jgi:hypothetical protein
VERADADYAKERIGLRPRRERPDIGVHHPIQQGMRRASDHSADEQSARAEFRPHRGSPSVGRARDPGNVAGDHGQDAARCEADGRRSDKRVHPAVQRILTHQDVIERLAVYDDLSRRERRPREAPRGESFRRETGAEVKRGDRHLTFSEPRWVRSEVAMYEVLISPEYENQIEHP